MSLSNTLEAWKLSCRLHHLQRQPSVKRVRQGLDKWPKSDRKIYYARGCMPGLRVGQDIFLTPKGFRLVSHLDGYDHFCRKVRPWRFWGVKDSRGEVLQIQRKIDSLTLPLQPISTGVPRNLPGRW